MVISLALVLALAAPAAPAASSDRPDVVLVLLDDLDAVTSRPFVEQILEKTLVLERSGVRFDLALSTTPICCPSRATLLSGCEGHTTGVLTNGGPTGGWRTFQQKHGEQHTLATALAAEGYRTMLIGKYMNQYELDGKKAPPVPPGWTDWAAIVDGGIQGYVGYDFNLLEQAPKKSPSVVHYGHASADYSTDVFRDKAVAFLQSAGSAPAFLYLAPTAPHLPLPPAPRHAVLAQKWQGTLPKTASYFADGAEVSDKPKWLRDSWSKRTLGLLRAFNDKDWADRLGSLYAVDDMIAAVVATQRARGRFDHTLFVVVSDNGYNLGAHGLVHKMAPYEESLRVPLFVAGGAALGLRAAVIDAEHMVTLADLAPTIVELTGARGLDVDGRSLAPLLRAGPPPPWRATTLIEYDGGGAANGIGQELRSAIEVFTPAVLLDLPTWRGLRATLVEGKRSLSVKYVEWPDTNERELYFLDDDPRELDNQAVLHPAQNKAVLDALHTRLVALSMCKGESCRTGEGPVVVVAPP